MPLPSAPPPPHNVLSSSPPSSHHRLSTPRLVSLLNHFGKADFLEFVLEDEACEVEGPSGPASQLGDVNVSVHIKRPVFNVQADPLAGGLNFEVFVRFQDVKSAISALAHLHRASLVYQTAERGPFSVRCNGPYIRRPGCCDFPPRLQPARVSFALRLALTLF